jgi:hypothetical protein
MPPWSRTNAALLSILSTVVDTYERAVALWRNNIRFPLGWNRRLRHRE